MTETDEPLVITRRAPHMERYTDFMPYVAEDAPEGVRLFLKIGVQRFPIWDYYETRQEGEWTRDMLCNALDTLRTELVNDCIAQLAEMKGITLGPDLEGKITEDEALRLVNTSRQVFACALERMRDGVTGGDFQERAETIDVREFAAKLASAKDPCTHDGYSFAKHGRGCPHCGAIITDFGD